MRSHAQDGAGFPSNQHYFHFLFILNEPLRAPWFCFLEEVEQHGTRTGAACPADPSAAVLTGMPSHTLSWQRDDVVAHKPAGDAPRGRNAQPRVGCNCPVFNRTPVAPPPSAMLRQCQAGADAVAWESGQERPRVRPRCSRRREDRRGGVLPAPTGSACECSGGGPTTPGERGTRLVLSSYPLQNAPKPLHSLIKSSLVVSHRHKVIR